MNEEHSTLLLKPTRFVISAFAGIHSFSGFRIFLFGKFRNDNLVDSFYQSRITTTKNFMRQVYIIFLRYCNCETLGFRYVYQCCFFNFFFRYTVTFVAKPLAQRMLLGVSFFANKIRCVNLMGQVNALSRQTRQNIAYNHKIDLATPLSLQYAY